MRRTFSLVMAMVLSTATNSAHADANLNCDAYATMAVAQNQENQQFGCNYGGGRWSNDYNGHKTWCQSANVQMHHLTNETNARTSMLNQCKGNKATICDSYAHLMTANAQKAAASNCGLSGGRYSENTVGHRTWCMGATNAQILQEQNASNAALQNCTSTKTAGMCAFYATAMAGLQDKYTNACAGRPDFKYGAMSIQQLKDQCAAQSGGNTAWSDAQVAAMNQQIARCESNTITYKVEPYRGVPIDACTSHPFCGNAAAERFCEWKGHSWKGATFKYGKPAGFAAHIDCVIDGSVNRDDERGECFCKGNCGTMAEVTCTGTK